jgi:hypothetical protein
VHPGIAAILALGALAPAPTVDIIWDAPPECGSRDELVGRIETLLGRPLGQPGDPDLEVVGRVEAEADGLLLVLDFRQPVARVRELRGRSCDELRDGVALVLAVTIDPLVPVVESSGEPAAPPERNPEPAAAPEPAVATETEPAPEPPTEPRSAPELGVLLRFAGGIQYLALPGIAGGPSLAVALRWRALRVELVGTWWLSKAARFEQLPEVGATLSLGWVAPRLCGVPSTARVSFPLCAGVEFGGMRGAAFGLADARIHTLPWIAAELGGALRAALPGPMALWIGVEGVIPLVRPGFTIAGLGELHRVPALAFQALLGLEIQFDSSRPTDPRRVGQPGGA